MKVPTRASLVLASLLPVFVASPSEAKGRFLGHPKEKPEETSKDRFLDLFVNTVNHSVPHSKLIKQEPSNLEDHDAAMLRGSTRPHDDTSCLRARSLGPLVKNSFPAVKLAPPSHDVIPPEDGKSGEIKKDRPRMLGKKSKPTMKPSPKLSHMPSTPMPTARPPKTPKPSPKPSTSPKPKPRPTPRPETPRPSQELPTTGAPVTSAPVLPTPTQLTSAPTTVTTAPVIAAPITTAPAVFPSLSPITLAPVTPSSAPLVPTPTPFTSTPTVTTAPITAPPITPAPAVFPPPVSLAPVTLAPVTPSTPSPTGMPAKKIGPTHLAGWNTALSRDGSVLGCGDPDATFMRPSSVSVLQYDRPANNWTQIGQVLISEEDPGGFGASLALNDDGETLAVGDARADKIFVYRYSNTTNIWEQIGQTLGPEPLEFGFGGAVSLSANGEILAYSSGATGVRRARVMQLNGTTWNQIGQTIIEGSFAGFGASISLSSDGYTVAVGASGSSVVRIYDYGETTNTWNLVGKTITDDGGRDMFGISISLDDSGRNVAIGGSETFLIQNTGPGFVSVFTLNETIADWSLVGQTLEEDSIGDQFGRSVSFAGDASAVAIGVPFLKDGSGFPRGLARIFTYSEQLNTWIQLGDDFVGGFNDRLGSSVSIAGGSSVVAFGALSVPYIETYELNLEDKTSSPSSSPAPTAPPTDSLPFSQLGLIYLFGWNTALSQDGQIMAVGDPDAAFMRPSSVRVLEYDKVSNDWKQLGQLLTSTEASTGFLGFGASLELDDDGETLAIGDARADKIFVYRYSNTTNIWEQIGQTLGPEPLEFGFGGALSLSANGEILAYSSGATGVRRARVMQLNGTMWNQIGQTIIEGSFAGFGASISLSSDGVTVAVGASGSSVVRIYDYGETTNTWNLVGKTITDDGGRDMFGISISLDDSGRNVAIGGSETFLIQNTGPGFVSVFTFNDTIADWSLVGQTLEGDSIGDQFGRSVSLAGDASAVAIGVPFVKGGDGFPRGLARIYTYSGQLNTWAQFGQDLLGQKNINDDTFGFSVSLASNATVVAVGSSNKPYVQALQYTIF